MIHAYRDDPRVTHTFIIDHALRAGSASEVAEAANFARDLGYHVQTNKWSHDGITSAVQVKARQYRYEALGRMCRSAGIETLLTAHTADDQAETLLMRLQRQTGWRGLAGMPELAFAPLWPALAGITLYRPWLNISRADLREYNAHHRLPFIDDPSNENRDFTRVRARQALSAEPKLRGDLLAQQSVMRETLTEERLAHAHWLDAHAKIDPQGHVVADSVPPSELLLHILRAVSGSGGPIDSARREALIDSMTDPSFSHATLAGAWVVSKPLSQSFVFTRDMVAVKGRKEADGLPDVNLRKGESTLWDGRFQVSAKEGDITIRPAHGRLSDLRQQVEIKPIFDLEPEVRSTLPVYFRGEVALGFGAIHVPEVQSIPQTARRLQSLYPRQPAKAVEAYE